MNTARIDQLQPVPHAQRSRRASRIWREWCFFRVALRHFRVRVLLMAAILVGGAFLFRHFEPEKNHSFARAVFFTWSLVFAQPPEEFPKSLILRLMFFVVPVLGLTVIIEGIIDFALMLRERRRFERSWCTMLASSFKDHIVLVGFGKLGYRIFNVLRKLGEAVVVIERDPNNQFFEELRRDGSPLLIGDGRQDVLLTQANIARARSVILATDDDLANLEIALDAQRLSPKIRVVMRMFDQQMADKVSNGFKFHMAASQTALSAPTFATSAVAPSIVSSFIVGNQLVAMQRVTIEPGHSLCGKTIGQIMSDAGVGIVEHSPRNGSGSSRVLPPPETRIVAGDQIVVQGLLETLARLHSPTG